MENLQEVLNYLFKKIFQHINDLEEKAIKESQFQDVTINEVHTIEAIGPYGAKSMSEVARELHITVGTLTVAINNLVRKGYVERFRSEKDRRVVKICLVERGRLLYDFHAGYHQKMIHHVMNDLSTQEQQILVKALGKVNLFFEEKLD